MEAPRQSGAQARLFPTPRFLIERPGNRPGQIEVDLGAENAVSRPACPLPTLPAVRRSWSAFMDDHYLAVDDGFAWYGERAGNLGKALGPIQTVASEDLLSSAVEVDLDAITIVLDLMKPLLAVGSLGLQRCELGLNEPRHG